MPSNELRSLPGTNLFARRAFLPEGFVRDLRIRLDDSGQITDVARVASPAKEDFDLGAGILLPAACNLHSHTFQRAMAGRTGFRKNLEDDFWSWREEMYRFVARLTPEQVEAIAALAFVEMLEAGYAAVGEFHYLHHQPDGSSYANPAELSSRIFAAAASSGIGLTHLPVLYSHGNAGCSPLSDRQFRFGCDFDRFEKLVTAAKRELQMLPSDTRIGIAPHSLRAVAPGDLEAAATMEPDGPVHIHAAEQEREVAEIVHELGARPVRYLLDACDLNPRWCVVHATHMNEQESVGLAKSGAVAGVCPITEADLGDGTFNGNAYCNSGGILGVGTDSNVRISLSLELAQLEYSQRLALKRRNVLTQSGERSGESLYLRALRGGAQALARPSGSLEPGLLADLVVLDGDHISFSAADDSEILDSWIFGSSGNAVRDVWSAGRHVVQGGRHRARESIERDFRAAIAELRKDG